MKMSKKKKLSRTKLFCGEKRPWDGGRVMGYRSFLSVRSCTLFWGLFIHLTVSSPLLCSQWHFLWRFISFFPTFYPLPTPSSPLCLLTLFTTFSSFAELRVGVEVFSVLKVGHSCGLLCVTMITKSTMHTSPWRKVWMDIKTALAGLKICKVGYDLSLSMKEWSSLVLHSPPLGNII